MSEPRKQSRRDVLILLGRTAALSLFPSGLIAESTAVEEPIGDASATLNAARGLIRRIVPASASHFSVELIATDNGRDVFEIEGRSGKIILRGNTGVSAQDDFAAAALDFKNIAAIVCRNELHRKVGCARRHDAPDQASRSIQSCGSVANRLFHSCAFGNQAGGKQRKRCRTT